jgi:hypothetical protein
LAPLIATIPAHSDDPIALARSAEAGTVAALGLHNPTKAAIEIDLRRPP